MLKAIRIHAFQQMPNYRKPASYLIKETYPLPPYSSVIGMTHVLCGWDTYHPLRVSVQGRHASVISDYATNYAFGTMKYDASRHTFAVSSENGKSIGVTRTPKTYEVLTDVELVLHIVPEDQSEETLEHIQKSFQTPSIYPSLGRYEDLLQIEEIDLVELDSAEDSIEAKYDLYIPVDCVKKGYANNLTGTVYRVGKVFGYRGKEDKKTKVKKKSYRIWKESYFVQHIAEGSVLTLQSMLEDQSFHDAVFPV